MKSEEIVATLKKEGNIADSCVMWYFFCKEKQLTDSLTKKGASCENASYICI